MKTTITEISKSTGISKSYLCELKSGAKDNPTNKIIVLIAKFFEIEPFWPSVKKSLSNLELKAPEQEAAE